MEFEKLKAIWSVAKYLIGPISTIIVFIWKKRSDVKHKREKAELEAEKNKALATSVVVSKIYDFFTKNSDIENAVDLVLKNTQFDNYILMLAMNGKRPFKRVDIIETYPRKHDAHPYLQTVPDDYYLDMLQKLSKNKVVQIKTSEMPESDLKIMYTTLGVKFSKIRLVQRIKIDDNHTALLYGRFASTTTDNISNSDKLLAKNAHLTAIAPALRKMFKIN